MNNKMIVFLGGSSPEETQFVSQIAESYRHEKDSSVTEIPQTGIDGFHIQTPIKGDNPSSANISTENAAENDSEPSRITESSDTQNGVPLDADGMQAAPEMRSFDLVNLCGDKTAKGLLGIIYPEKKSDEFTLQSAIEQADGIAYLINPFSSDNLESALASEKENVLSLVNAVIKKRRKNFISFKSIILRPESCSTEDEQIVLKWIQETAKAIRDLCEDRLVGAYPDIIADSDYLFQQLPLNSAPEEKRNTLDSLFESIQEIIEYNARVGKRIKFMLYTVSIISAVIVAALCIWLFIGDKGGDKLPEDLGKLQKIITQLQKDFNEYRASTDKKIDNLNSEIVEINKKLTSCENTLNTLNIEDIKNQLETIKSQLEEFKKINPSSYVTPKAVEELVRKIIKEDGGIIEYPPKPEPPTPEPQAGDLLKITHNGIEYNFRYCPKGAFIMQENSKRNITFSKGFWMLESEVTQEMWQSVKGGTPSNHIGDKYPVEQVTWTQCDDFCNKLGKSLNLQFRLPSEAQWEYACREGGKIKNFDVNYLNQHAIYSTSSTNNVKSKQPNAWGLYDMCGNVAEWCNDYYDDLGLNISLTDPTGPNTGTYRVTRGGYFKNSSSYVNGYYRYYGKPDNKSDKYGFRFCADEISLDKLKNTSKGVYELKDNAATGK